MERGIKSLLSKMKINIKISFNSLQQELHQIIPGDVGPWMVVKMPPHLKTAWSINHIDQKKQKE